MRAIKILLIATALITAISCSWRNKPEPQVQYVPVVVHLPLPPRPMLPPVDAAQIECLTDDVVRLIVQRDQMRRNYAAQLETIIKSTHTKARQE